MTGQTVILFGATSGGGLELARLLRAQSRPVVAVVRETSDTKLLKDMGVETQTADAFEAGQVDAALHETAQDAIIVSFLGGGFKEGRPVDGIGNINAINAATRAGAERFILMTSVGCGDSYDAAPDMSKQLWTELWKIKNEGEDHLMASGLSWTIIRPGGLLPPEPTGNGILVEDPLVFGMINRKDLGDVAYRAVNSTAVIGKTFTAVDSGQSQHVKDGPVVAAEV